MATEQRGTDFTRELQTNLRRISRDNKDIPEIAIDGIYGKQTREAVSAFQRSAGLPVTGEADIATWTAVQLEYNRLELLTVPPVRIDGFPSPDTVFSIGDEGWSVQLIQIMLNTIARTFINITDVPETGVYDGATAATVGEIQQSSGLPVNGSTNLATWNVIASVHNSIFRRRTIIQRDAE